MKLILNILIFSLFLFSAIAQKLNSQKSTKSTARSKNAAHKKINPTDKKQLFQPPKDTGVIKRKPQAEQSAGVILSFHQWPDPKQKQILIDHLKKEGLIQTKSFDRYKIWIFSWEDSKSKKILKSKKKAVQVCKNLPKLSAVKYCESNTLVSINNNKTTEAGAGCVEYIEEVKNNDISSVSKIVDNVKACQFMPSQQTVGDIVEPEKDFLFLLTNHSSKSEYLSLYWAQELIGADLLKEELEKMPPPEKANFITVFDYKRDFLKMQKC